MTGCQTLTIFGHERESLKTSRELWLFPSRDLSLQGDSAHCPPLRSVSLRHESLVVASVRFDSTYVDAFSDYVIESQHNGAISMDTFN